MIQVWGPVIAFGRGGRETWSAHRPHWRVAPLADLDVVDLVADVDPTLDAQALGPVLRAVEALLLAHPEIIEIDVNPCGSPARGRSLSTRSSCAKGRRGDGKQGALDGLKVVDFGQYIAGPLLAMLLADAGAEVVHVDPPGGPRWDDPANAVLQRGKRSVQLDLKGPRPRRLVDLVSEADVLVENFRPGVMDRLGLGYDACSAAEPSPRLLLDPRVQRRRSALVDAGVGGRRVRGDLDLSSASPLRPRGSDHRHGPVVHRHTAAVDVCGRDRCPRRCCRAARSGSFGKGSTCRGVAVRRRVPGLWPRAADGAQHGVGRVQAASPPGLGHYRCKDGRWLHLCLFEDRHMRWFAQEFVPDWLAEGVAEPDRLRAEPELQVELIKRFSELFVTGRRRVGA